MNCLPTVHFERTTGIRLGPTDESGAFRVEDDSGVRWVAPEPPDVPTSEES